MKLYALIQNVLSSRREEVVGMLTGVALCKTSVDSAVALEMIRGVIETAAQYGYPSIAVAIVDTDGHRLASARMNGMAFQGLEDAEDAAKASICTIRRGYESMGALHNPDTCEVMGAIGISGVDLEQNYELLKKAFMPQA